MIITFVFIALFEPAYAIYKLVKVKTFDVHHKNKNQAWLPVCLQCRPRIIFFKKNCEKMDLLIFTEVKYTKIFPKQMFTHVAAEDHMNVNDYLLYTQIVTCKY